MKKKVILYLTLFAPACALFVGVYYLFIFPIAEDFEQDMGLPNRVVHEAASGDASPAEPPMQKVLDVPYINEAPDGNWTGPWKNACEEAAIVMVERFYKGQTQVAIADARAALLHLFAFQNKRWGSNANSDAARTADIANSLGLFAARVITDPALEDIKKEIVAGRPVITMHKGFDLGNKNIPFLATGSSYHTLVIIGYDDATGEFITNDDGDEKAGRSRRYAYDVVMSSMHDYNYKTNTTDAPPRALFTSPL